MSRRGEDPVTGRRARESADPRIVAAREIMRLAGEDRGRGIQYWFDGELTDSLRDLVKEAGTPRIAPPAVPPAASPAVPLAAPPALAKRPSRDGPMVWGPPAPAEGREEGWEAQLASLSEEAAQCMACGLCRTRKKVVFGSGRGIVPVVFVGEAPGADEDAQGLPFVGRAGQLLTKIIEAIGLKREDVYICNVLKCRPPENRNPAPDEIEKCSPFLQKQLTLLRPKVVCTLGLFATQTLLETSAPIGKLRGRLITHRGLCVLPTYHPAALLRNPSLKPTVWEDVQLLRRLLDE